MRLFGILFSIALFVTAGAAFAQESTEEAGQMQSFIPILADGDTVEGVFEGETTAQLYGFNGSAGDTVSISMVQDADTALDPYIVLLGERGQVLASDDDSGEGVALSSQITNFELPYDGSYLILATSFIYIDTIGATEDGLAEAQPYTLTVGGITPPEALESFDPDTLLLFSGEVAPGMGGDAEVTEAEPVYYFRFDGTAGDTVSITASSAAFDTIIHLFDPNGARVAVNDDADGTNSAIEAFTLPEDGTYLFFISAYDFYRIPLGEEVELGLFTLNIE